MDTAEKVAGQMLSAMGYANVRHEPDGNIPPDFAVGGSIAVEVRRLLQHHDDGAGPRGLTEAAIPLQQHVFRLLPSMGTADEPSWWVSVNFGRPLPPWKVLQAELRPALQAFMDSKSKQPGDLFRRGNFRVAVAEAGYRADSFFMLAGFTDLQAGGWVVAEYLNNIKHCIEDKRIKTGPYRERYAEWWLVLVDYTGLGTGRDDLTDVASLLPPSPDWDRVIIVSPGDPSRWFAMPTQKK